MASGLPFMRRHATIIHPPPTGEESDPEQRDSHFNNTHSFCFHAGASL